MGVSRRGAKLKPQLLVFVETASIRWLTFADSRKSFLPLAWLILGKRCALAALAAPGKPSVIGLCSPILTAAVPASTTAAFPVIP